MNIDRIAREMVDVEPSATLEARIRARLDEARPGRTPAWRGWRVAVPVGAIATAALATALIIGVPGTRSPEVVSSVGVRGASGPEGVTSVGVQGLPAEAQSAKVGPEVVIASQLPKIPTSQLPKIPTSLVPKIAASQLSAAELAWMERRLPALVPVTALHMEQLQMDSIQPEPLAITPLTMTPVSTEGAGSERRNDR